MGWRKNMTALCPYLFLGVILGCIPPLITLHVMSDFETSKLNKDLKVQGANRHVRNPRAVNIDLNHFETRDDTVSESFIDVSVSMKAKLAARSNDKQLYRPNKDFMSLSSISSLGFKKKLFIAVLSEETRVTKMSSAAGITWAGSGNADVHFLYPSLEENSRSGSNDKVTQIPLTVGSRDNDIIRSASYMCEGVRDQYSWYVLTTDNMYVDTKALTALLETLYPKDNIVMGKPTNGECLSNEPMILSAKALQLMCDSISKCTEDGNNSNKFGRCLKAVTKTPCIDIAKIKESSLALSGDGKKRLKRIEDDRELFYTGMTNPDDLYNKHLEIMDKIIQNTKHKLAILKDDIISVRPNSDDKKSDYLKDWQGKIDKSTLNSSRPSHKFFDFTGISVKDNCKVSKSGSNSVFNAAKKVADDEVVISNNDNKHKSFGYIQSMSALEVTFEFYYTETLVKNERGVQKKVNRVTVGQTYTDLSITSTRATEVKPTYIVTTLLNADLENVDNLLKTTQLACSNLQPFHIGCTLIILKGNPFTKNEHATLKDTVDRFKESIRIAEDVNPIHVNVIDEHDSINHIKNLSSNGTLIHIPANYIFIHEFLLRCHINVAQNNSVYFPIPFKLLVPETHWMKQKEFSSSKGFWLTQDFQTFSVDLQYFINQSLSIDRFYESIKAKSEMMSSNRYPDPGIIVPWQEKDCNNGQLASKESSCLKNFIYKHILST